MSRGILWIVWKGESDPSASLERSTKSAKFWHPELEQKVVEMPAGSNLLVKSQMYDLSPFDETLFLDADTTVLGKLDYGFSKAHQHGIACCINANPWNRRYYNIKQPIDEVEYSSGVVFFDRDWYLYDDHSASVSDVFNDWARLTPTTDSRSSYLDANGVRREMACNDQAIFTLAMHQNDFNPFVLPLNWNLHPKFQKHFWGEVKIWHGCDDIPPELLKWNERQRNPDNVIMLGGLP